MKEYLINKVSVVLTFSLMLTLTLTSCNDFLDELPDNRTEANTVDKIQKLLVSAYPVSDHMAFTEYGSDNVDFMGPSFTNTSRFLDQCYTWEDITEGDNQDPENYWEEMYKCIETANMALEGIESMGGATTTQLKEVQAEALLCRAYAHFMLVNLFALHYDSNDASSLGVTYVTETENELNKQYQRETVQQNYAHIAEDIEKALPNIGDSYYTVPKYHFNKRAAYAFACRFYLYYEKYDKAIQCANMVLGSNPAVMLRDWATLDDMPDGSDLQQDPTTLHMIDANLNCNLMLLTSYSQQGVTWYYCRYSHNAYIGKYETIGADGDGIGLAALWKGDYSSYSYRTKIYEGSGLNSWTQWRLPYLMEITDQATGNGYVHTVYPAFTGDEVLLNRAEAYILLKQYDKACEDLTTWVRNVSKKKSFTVTVDVAKAFETSFPYSYDGVDDSGNAIPKGSVTSTPKKHLNPKFAIDEEGSEQESMIQLVLQCRRYETLQEGKRWFDIKRWGIEIPRRTMNSSGYPQEITDWLTVDDPRRAIQFPVAVVSAGYEPNPRVSEETAKIATHKCIKE